MATVLAAGFCTVMVKTLLAPIAPLVGLNDLVTMGAATALTVAVALVPVTAVPATVPVTGPVLLILSPPVVAVGAAAAAEEEEAAVEAVEAVSKRQVFHFYSDDLSDDPHRLVSRRWGSIDSD